GVMTRLHLFEGTGIEMRIHFFEDPEETFIHNHRNTFFSHCLAGKYVHRIWRVEHENDPDKEHFAVNRTKDPELTSLERRPGELTVKYLNTHVENATYFIPASTPHTVLPNLDGARPTPTATIYIKGRRCREDTWVLSPTEQLAEQNRKPERLERQLTGLDKLSALQRLGDVLKRGKEPRRQGGSACRR
ncbi:unnamed protein product, partial [Effrenium voratum]